MSKRKNIEECKNNADDFCYVCGDFAKKCKRNFTTGLQEIYYQYFRIKAVNLEEPWTPNAICSVCRTNLTDWHSGLKR